MVTVPGVVAAFSARVLVGLSIGGFWAVAVSIQTWILRTAPNTEAATALMAFTFNRSSAWGPCLGAMFGGQIVDDTSLPVAMWTASGLFLLGALLVLSTPAKVVGQKAR
ncbi:MAG: major facilitator superfamily transporter [Halomonas sp. 54_146]|nr:MAG: major facilitator superfamily transporter [Halomonas sp. 54_146]